METKIEGGVVVEGAATGHSHVATGDGVEVYEGPEGRRGSRLIKASDDGVTMIHPEHKPIHMPCGIYQTGIANEVDHLAEVTRQVID